jgi:hypothetical protein
MKKLTVTLLGGLALATLLLSACAGASAPEASAGSPTVKSSDATLSALAVTASGSAVTLSPSFAAATTDYTATVSSNVSSVEVSATATSSAATVSGTGAATLAVGANTVPVAVTAEDGTKKAYTIVVTRLSPDSDATVSALAVDAKTNYKTALSPAFSPDVTDYKMYVDSSVPVVYLNVTPTNSDATVTGTGEKKIVAGSNSFPVVVTSKDGTVKTTYTINIVSTGTHTVSGNVTLPAGAYIFEKDQLYVGAIPSNSDKWVGVTVIGVIATTYKFTLKDIPVGTYLIKGFNLLGVGSSFDTGFHNMDGVPVTVCDADISGVTLAMTAPKNTITVETPTAGSDIADTSITFAGKWFGLTPPKTLTVSFGGTAVVLATLNSNYTWNATIDASKVGNTAGGRTKQLRAIATWADGSVMNTFADYQFSGGVASHSVSGTVTLLAGVSEAGKYLYVFIDGVKNWDEGGTKVAERNGTSFSYTLYDVPEGTHTIQAYTNSGDSSPVSGTSYYIDNWAGFPVTVGSADLTGIDFALTAIFKN